MELESVFCSTSQSGTSTFPLLSSLSPFRRQQTARVTVKQILIQLLYVSISYTFGSRDILKEMKLSSLNSLSICYSTSIYICFNSVFYKPSPQFSLWYFPTLTMAIHNNQNIEYHRWHPSWHSFNTLKSSPLGLFFQALCKDGPFHCSHTAEHINTILNSTDFFKLKLQLCIALPRII